MNDERPIDHGKLLHEELHEKLRRLHMDDPDPALRSRTVSAMRRELVQQAAGLSAPCWRAAFRAWRTEALYLAAILLCAVFLPWPDLPGRGRPEVRTAAPSAHDEAIVRELGLAGDLADNVRSRLALQRDLQPPRRTDPHDFHRNLNFRNRAFD